MKYHGGYKDGQDVEPENLHADEIKVGHVEIVGPGSANPFELKLGAVWSVDVYTPDAFGGMAYRYTEKSDLPKS